MSDIIGFAEFISNRVFSPSRAKGVHQQATGFTLRDREDLEEWSTQAHRATVCSSDMGAFAMLHQTGRPWASWGVVRQGRSVLLWDCVTLADIGLFPSMVDALAAVPIDSFHAPVANVIEFAAARARASQMG